MSTRDPKTDRPRPEADAVILAPPMKVDAALQVLVTLRDDDQIVVTNQGSAREWPKLCDHPLDFHYIPSTMSGAIPLGLGLALAQKKREVLVVSGDGSLLMSLGCLMTVAASGAENITIALFDNGVYEVTGGQKTAGSVLQTDYAGIACAAGFPNVSRFHNLEDWQGRAKDILAKRGPRFIHLTVEPVMEDYLLDPPCPISEQLERLRKGLGV